jgi:phosphomannomutase/phosphoglucomutase
MKLGKKKSADESGGEPSSKPAKNKKQASSRPGTRKLGPVSVYQAMVVLLSGVVASALLYVVVIEPAARKQAAQQAAQQADGAAARLEQRLELLERMVTGYAGQPQVIEAVGDRSRRSQTVEGLSRLLPSVTNAFIFPYGEIPRRASAPEDLGFANLDLARRAESGRSVTPDAFPRNNQWFVQIAAPIKNESSRVVGSVLVVFDTQVLSSLLRPEGTEVPGRVALVQTIGGQAQTVVQAGQGAGQPVSRALSPANWKLEYTPASGGTAPAMQRWPAFIVVIAPTALAALAVWLLTVSVQRKQREDMAALTLWAQKVFSGERVGLPTLRWELASSLGEMLQRLSQVVEKRVSKAGEASRTGAGKKVSGAPRPSQPATRDEPLFQETDALDIDMLDGDEDVLGFGEAGMVEESRLPEVTVAPSIFRAYDIRGVVGETLTKEVVMVIGQAIGSEAVSRQNRSLCVGYDGRHSSPEFADALVRGILSTGCDVIELGAVPTPVLYFATHHLETGSGVMVTGSHNPSNYNGLKVMLGGETLSGEAIQKLLRRIQHGDFEQGQGDRSGQDVRRAYLDRIVGDIAVAAPLKVVLDAGNGIAGELGPMLIEELGCEVVPLYCEVDGSFPNHHPDPGNPENLKDLIARVDAEKADIGLAFDGDGDRLGVVTNSGKIIWADRLMMLFARDVVSRNPGADVIYDVKCSRRLASVISEAGGRPVMWKSGHSLMKAKMRETGALLGGEMSGHVFFSERWYGFDDGLYTAARLLEILGIEDRQIDEVFEEFPEDISTPELNVAVSDESKFELVEQLANKTKFGEGNVNTIDGVRVDYPDGWGLCRASNTTPSLVLRFEAESEEALERIKSIFRNNLKKVAPDLVTNF